MAAISRPTRDLILIQESAAVRDANFTVLSPAVRGQGVFLLDTGELLFWYGPYHGWCKPWNMAWGVLGYAEITSNTGVLPLYNSTNPPIAGLSVTVNVWHQRLYEVEFLGQIDSSIAGNTVAIDLNASRPHHHADNDSLLSGENIMLDTLTEQAVSTGTQIGIAGTPANIRCQAHFIEDGPTPFYVTAANIGGGANDAFIVANKNSVAAIRVIDIGPFHSAGPTVS